MALNTLYVSLNADMATAKVGDPTHPYTLRGAINYVNTQNTTALWFSNVSNGIFTLECPNPLTISGNVMITGAGPRNTIINPYQINITDGAQVYIQSCALKSCQSVTMINVQNGSCQINNAEISVTSGTFFTITNGTVIINGCTIYIQSVTSNPVVNAAGGNLFVTNSNFYFKFTNPPNTSLALIGNPPQAGAITLTNAGLSIQLHGGQQPIIPFYNTENINGSVVQISGTGSENVILIGNDVMPTIATPQNASTQIPYFVNNVHVTISKLANVYSYYNLHDYPLVISNVTWSGVAAAPAPYSRQRLNTSLPTRSAAPAAACVTGSCPPTSAPATLPPLPQQPPVIPTGVTNAAQGTTLGPGLGSATAMNPVTNAAGQPIPAAGRPSGQLTYLTDADNAYNYQNPSNPEDFDAWADHELSTDSNRDFAEVAGW